MNMNFEIIVKTLRRKMLLTQEEFAKMIGTSFSAVNRWENGKSTPSIKAQRKIKELCSKYGMKSMWR